MSMHVLLKHRASIPDFQFLTDVLFLFLELTLIPLLYSFTALFFLLCFLDLHAVFWDFLTTCVSSNNSLLCVCLFLLCHTFLLCLSQGGMYGERQASLPLMDSYNG